MEQKGSAYMDGKSTAERQLMIKGEFPFLTADATSEQVWKHFYHLATLFAKSKELAPSLNCYIDVFLIRGNEMHSPDQDWLDFFRRQFAIYLMGKKCISCSLSEGDMIHDFLRMEYEQIKQELQNSEFAFQKENLSRWFASLELDFPWLVETEDLQWSFG
ncbi:MAG: hypothetical protein VB127_11995 [Sphaerochaeta sp.]|jgi:hypothetical protein|nr:hypothetical protein [Sphaerochaeta sp.]